jgi:hypothetical protein
VIAAVAPLLALAALAAEPGRSVVLGPTERHLSLSDPALVFPFAARADEELTAATLHLAFTPPGPGRPRLHGVEVIVNSRRVALLSADAVEAAGGAAHQIAIPAELLAPRNQLQLRLLVRPDGACAATPGVWRAVSEIRLALETAPVPLPDELALLPLPFLDRDFDAATRVPLVLGGEPSAERVRAAALVARWLAVDAPIPVELDAQLGGLPDGRAVVLVSGSDEAARLGLAPPLGPEIRMTDHPRRPQSNEKLLVVAGRDAAELRTAAERLASGRAPLVGARVALAPAAPPTPALAGAAPRWVPSERAVPFAEYPGTRVLAHEGSSPATLSVRFRVPPDLFIWPAEFVTLDLGWSERIPEGAAPPRLDVEMNGFFLATLPQPDGAGHHERRARLRIPREHMRGFNELLVHVRHADPDPCAQGRTEARPTGGGPRVEIAPDSVLHIEGLSRFAVLPDVSLFAFDGYPFTRLADLGETAVVLPSRPAPQELSALLSILARLAQFTGRADLRATFVAADAPDAELRGKDLLVVAAAPGSPLLRRWSNVLPVSFDAGRAHVRRHADLRANLELLGGLGPLLDARRAAELASGAASPAAIAAIESPLSPGRSAVFVTAASAAQLPRFGEFLGYAESRARGGDLLLQSPQGRWMFRLGGTFGRGELDRWTRLRWFLAGHWLALVPLLACGAFLIALEARRHLAARIRARLATGAPA